MVKRIGVRGWALLAAGVLAAGCPGKSGTDAGVDSGSPPDSGPGIDAGQDAGGSCLDFATAECGFESVCEAGLLQSTYGSLPNCVNELTLQCQTWEGAPGTGVTPTWAEACSASFNTRAAACDGGPVPQPVPTPTDPCAIVGSLAGGSPCGVESQCATGVCFRAGVLCGLCTSSGTAGQACGPGTGVTCQRGLVCGVKGTCTPEMSAGAGCDRGSTASCTIGTQCVYAGAGSDSGTCVAAGATVGAPCDPNSYGTPTCFDLAGFGCNPVTHLCEQTTYAGAGAPCGFGDGGATPIACLTGTCSSGTCSAKAVIGAGCTVGSGGGCGTASVCVRDPAGLAGTCTAVDGTCSMQDAGVPEFQFEPSNISLAQIFSVAGNAMDENLSSACQIHTDATAPDALCLNSPINVITQGDGSTVNLIVVRSLAIQSTGSITVSGAGGAGGVPLVIVSLTDITLQGGAAINGDSTTVAAGSTGPGGGMFSAIYMNGLPAPGGGYAANVSGSIGGGGGSFCGIGGIGGGSTDAGKAYGARDLRPLQGGASGGGGWFLYGGQGGGAIQLAAAGTITVKAGATFNLGGAGGEDVSGSAFGTGGGGSGGALLLEAPAIAMQGTLASNGGGGGGTGLNYATDATANATPAPGGAGGSNSGAGGVGSAGATIAGAAGVSTASGGGGGGGGAGRIRLNSATATANTTGGVASPDFTTKCATQGALRAVGVGP